MTFLAPLFLLGAIAVAMPFWLHRLQVQSSDRRPFSSAMLLETTDQRVHVQKKLRYLVLLALRAALLILIVLAFARPLWTGAKTLPGPPPEGTHVVLIDTSASMGREGVFAAALELARDAIESAPDGAMLQVVAASQDLREVSALSADRGEQLAALQTLRADSTRLDFGRAMTAMDRLAGSLPHPVTLHFVSDLQDSGMPARFSDLVSAHVAVLETHVPAVARTDNWSVDAIRSAAAGIDVVASAAGGDDMTTRIELAIDGAVVGAEQVSGPGTTTVRFGGVDFEPGDNRIRADIATRDDAGIDNQRFLVVRVEPPAPVPLLTSDPVGLPVTYLSAALEADRSGNWLVEPVSVDRFDPRALSRYRWVVVDDVGIITPDNEAALIDFVERGGAMLAFAGQKSADLARLPVLGNAIGAASVGIRNEEFLSVGQADDSHPMLAATDGWYAVRASRTIPVEASLDDEVLVRLDNDEPFLIERRIGRGRVLLVAGGLENEWNDLPVRPVFVTFVVEAARYLSGAGQVERSFTVGDVLPLSIVDGVSGQVIDPDGLDVLSLADTTRAQRIRLDKTGFYEVYTPQGNYTVAVNPDPRESVMTRMAPATLQRWKDAMGGAAEPVESAGAGEAADPVELWHALLLLAALVLIAESVLANVYLAPRPGVELNR